LEALAGVRPAGCLLLVGHEPDLSSIAAELMGGRLDLKKGGVAALRLDGSSGELVVLLRPRELALIAGAPSVGE
jgi:phosphohistidine phosphatase